MRSTYCLVVSIAWFAFACSAPAHPDAAVDGSADAPGDAVTDASVDANDVVMRPNAITCQACRYDADCSGGGVCIEADSLKSPGIFSCAMPCAYDAAMGDHCDAPAGQAATCQPIGPGLVCVPTASTVTTTPPACFVVRAGTACTDATMCSGRYNLCAGTAGSAAMCVHACADDRDCDDGYRRCRMVQPVGGGPMVNACIKDPLIGPEACGVGPGNASGIGAACGTTGTTCASALTCLSGIDPLVGGFCSRSCVADSECSDGARCLAVNGHGMQCVPTDCACIAGSRDALLDHALAQVPWTRCNLYWDSQTFTIFGRLLAEDRFRWPVFDRVHLDWASGVAWPEQVAAAVDAHASHLSTLIASAPALAVDGNTSHMYMPTVVPALDVASPLAEAIARLDEAFGATANRGSLMTAAQVLPIPLQRALSSVVVAMTRAAQGRDHGLLHTQSPDDVLHLYGAAPSLVLAFTADALVPNDPLDQGAILGDVVLPVHEAADLAATIEAIDWSPWRGMTGVTFQAATPIGAIAVGDGGPNTWDSAHLSGDIALLLDLGGDDDYTIPVAANASPDNRVSVAIDLDGVDSYGYVPRSPLDPRDVPPFLPSDAVGRYHPRTGEMAGPMSRSDIGRQGSGRLGVALLYDFGQSNDHYRSLRMSQGFGALGIGGLYDEGGDDFYEIEAGGQGAGIHGIGVLLDQAGNDRYSNWAFAEGFAYVRGVGIEYDGDGTDQHLSNQHDVLYWSPQDPGHSNSSFTQGAGFGRRSDPGPMSDGVSMSGGLGILRDRTGDDTYTAAIFAQGTGYWGGMGLLLDGGGDDTYDAQWYVQGADAHFAYAALLDGGGHDVHTNAGRQNMTLGAGHDFSLGIFIARGNEADEYHAPNLALGAGNANGVGFFIENGGDDLYDATSDLSLGNAALEMAPDMYRDDPHRPTVGIFLDANGTDMYLRPSVPPPANDALWTQRIHASSPLVVNERGIAGDDHSALPGL